MTDPRHTSDTTAGAVAITGMSGRFPGAPDLDRYWLNLREGVESISTLSQETLAAEGIPPELFSRPEYVPRAASLDGADLFDAAFFQINARELEESAPVDFGHGKGPLISGVRNVRGVTEGAPCECSKSSERQRRA
ncbi:beta-ketoacyl synthase N-terminal-like domain-containing protein [Streptomyces sp. NPDC004629]|uniref:beta-ketoacyl synthase N-terminal-like domain-containing protein n=1 Tax=Streptomyces sp. NPDC004629 TaxID=3364705 RepID=UPI0036BD18FB